MSRLFKTVLLYLLMLAIPAQGFAASTMLLCGTAHQGVKTAQEIDHHAGHSHANIPAADHQDHLLPASVDSLGLASSDEGADFTKSDNGIEKTGEPGKFNCSACAACCVGAAIAAANPRFQLADQAIERIASMPFLHIGFVTDGPKRPPRSFPA